MIAGVYRGLLGLILLSGGIYILASEKTGVMPKSLNLTAAEIANYLMLGASIVTILLSLASISSSEKATREQIDALRSETTRQIRTQEYWNNIRRYQRLTAVIEEIKYDQKLYQQLVDNNKAGKYSQKFDNFIYVSMENFLSDSPTDNANLNQTILDLYYMIKVHDNKIIASRTANIASDSLKELLESIGKDYLSNKKIIEEMLKLLNENKAAITPQIPP